MAALAFEHLIFVDDPERSGGPTATLHFANDWSVRVADESLSDLFGSNSRLFTVELLTSSNADFPFAVWHNLRTDQVSKVLGKIETLQPPDKFVNAGNTALGLLDAVQPLIADPD